MGNEKDFSHLENKIDEEKEIFKHSMVFYGLPKYQFIDRMYGRKANSNKNNNEIKKEEHGPTYTPQTPRTHIPKHTY